MDHDLEVLPDPAAVAARAAGYVVGLARAAVAAGSRFSFAVSGGQTPWAMFRALAAEDMPWTSADLFQVDERVAPAGDPDRNLTHLRESLDGAAATVHPMPVEEEDLAKAAGALARAARILWLVTGADKQEPLARLLSGDRSIPAGRVQAGHSLVLADAKAAERVRSAVPTHRNGDQA